MVLILFNSNMFVYHANDGAINNCLPKLFNEVKDETRFAWSVCMEKASVRIQSCQNDSLLYLEVENTIAIVQCSIEAIHGSACFAANPLQLLWNNASDG